MSFRRPRAFRLRRVVGYTAGGVGIAVAGLLLLPREALPPTLLAQRVFLDGIGRVARCGVVGMGIYLDYTLSLRGKNDDAENAQGAWDAVHRRSAARLVRLAETNGGLYVKAGQVFANASHLLPEEFCAGMAVLQDCVAPRPFREIQTVLETDFQRPIGEVFEGIDPTPIAAASLAQVHRGVLRREGVEVAVKVQYIEIAQRFRGDMRTIDLMLRIAGWLYPGFDFGQILNRLTTTIGAELDFQLEARNSERAARDLRKGGFGNRVVCARIFPDYVRKRVLVSEFVDHALKISDRKGLIANGLDVREVSRNFFDAIAYQIFIAGFFHADPHAGNVLVHKLPDGSPQVVLLDYGLCDYLNAAQRKELSDIWSAAITHDNHKLSELAKRYHCNEYELFASCFLMAPYRYHTIKEKVYQNKDLERVIRVQVRERMHDINNIVTGLPKEYALVLRSLMATKAISHELGTQVGRSMCFLRFSLRSSHASASFMRIFYLKVRAWVETLYTLFIMSFLKYKSPELAETLETNFYA